MYRVLHAMVWVVSLGNGMFFSVEWILFVWHLTDSFRHINYAGWIVLLRGTRACLLAPLVVRQRPRLGPSARSR